jgi:hypothetical protein
MFAQVAKLLRRMLRPDVTHYGDPINTDAWA